MIRLEVQPYCQDCVGFEADVKKPEKIYGEDDIITMGDTVVRCTRRNTCESIKRYLEKHLEEDKG